MRFVRLLIAVHLTLLLLYAKDHNSSEGFKNNFIPYQIAKEPMSYNTPKKEQTNSVEPYLSTHAWSERMHKEHNDVTLGIGLNFHINDGVSATLAVEKGAYNYDVDGLNFNVKNLTNDYIQEGVIIFKINYKY